MAKKVGLGRGLDALMGGSNISSEPQPNAPVSESNAQALVSQEAVLEPNNVTPNAALLENGLGAKDLKTTLNLPKGIEVDSNGQLWVNPELLVPNPHQPRTEFDEEKLQELAASVKTDGILQPVTIEDAEDGTFYIIAGERRTRAAKIAELDKIPVQLKKYSDEKKLELALIENIQRENLNAIEEAKAYDKLMKMSGMTQDEVAGRVGKNRSTVANAVRLLRLPEDMQNALVIGTITAGHARALLSVTDSAAQRSLFDKIVSLGLSVRQAESEATALNAEGTGETSSKEKDSSKTSVQRDPDFVNIEQQFIDSLGTKVVMKGDFNKGSVHIEYFSRADLDKLYTLITGNPA